LQINNDADAAKSLWAEVLDIRDFVLGKAKVLESLPDAQSQGRTFGITPELALSIGQVHFFTGEYTEAENYLRIALDPNYNEPRDLNAAIFYLAALAKNGKEEPEFFIQLMGTFPDSQ